MCPAPCGERRGSALLTGGWVASQPCFHAHAILGRQSLAGWCVAWDPKAEVGTLYRLDTVTLGSNAGGPMGCPGLHGIDITDRGLCASSIALLPLVARRLGVCGESNFKRHQEMPKL